MDAVRAACVWNLFEESSENTKEALVKKLTVRGLNVRHLITELTVSGSSEHYYQT